MPIAIYHLPSWQIAIMIILGFEVLSIAGLVLTRRYLLPRLKLGEHVNEVVGGTIQSIGVFYGITLGLIAVGVWDTYSHAASLVSQEAANIGSLYRDVSGYPSPVHETLQNQLYDYARHIIEVEWPEQLEGKLPTSGNRLISKLQKTLVDFEPATDGKRALHSEALRAFNNLVESRRLRLDAVTGSLSGVMWMVILVGAAMSISVGYFFHVEDARLHAIMVSLMAGFLGIVVFLITTNDRPFMGDTSVSPLSYQLILEAIMGEGKH